MMRIVAADEPADLVARAQGIAGSADGRRVPGLKELVICRGIIPVGIIGVHPTGHIAKGELANAVQGRHIGAAHGNLGSVAVLDCKLAHDSR